jgi:hypothetical protein
VRLSPLGMSATNWPIVPSPRSSQMMTNVEQSMECELARETEILGENSPVPLCPPQIPHDMTWAQTRAVELGRR